VRDQGAALADLVEEVLPGWVERVVRLRLAAWSGQPSPEHVEAARDAGRRAVADVVPRLRTLLAGDVDEQATTPLTIIRSAVRYPGAVLRAAGVPPVVRDQRQSRLLPDDEYDLAPATWSDIDERLVEPGIAWGAAKAMEHRRRHGVAT